MNFLLGIINSALIEANQVYKIEYKKIEIVKLQNCAGY